jgi:hypothetical protein
MSVWRRGLALIALAILVVFSGFQTGVAQQDQSGSGLIISDTRYEREIMPGTSTTIKVSLKNVSGNAITAKSEINDFESDDQTGEPRVITNATEQSPTSIKPFTSGVNDFDLEKDEKKDFDVQLSIPNNAAAGAYYGIIRYSAVPKGQTEDADGGNVALTASVGTIVLITVPGDINEQIQLRSVKVGVGDMLGNFFWKKPDNSRVEIKNLGNGFSKPFGRVYMTNMSGDEVYSYELNNTDPRANILPNSTRIFKDKLEGVSTPGRYTVTASISHGSGGEVLTESVAFWYIPLWMLILIVIILVVLAVSIYAFYKRRFRPHSRKR